MQCIARLEVEEGYVSDLLIASQEVLEENRFLAARDGMDADLIDPERSRRVPAREILDEVLDACASHAHDLGCVEELEDVRQLAEQTGARRQIELARGPYRLPGLVTALADDYAGVPERSGTPSPA